MPTQRDTPHTATLTIQVLPAQRPGEPHRLRFIPEVGTPIDTVGGASHLVQLATAAVLHHLPSHED